jgi:hypothetical protein
MPGGAIYFSQLKTDFRKKSLRQKEGFCSARGLLYPFCCSGGRLRVFLEL